METTLQPTIVEEKTLHLLIKTTKRAQIKFEAKLEKD